MTRRTKTCDVVCVEPSRRELQVAYNRANAKVTRLLFELQAAESELRGAAVRLNKSFDGDVQQLNTEESV